MNRIARASHYKRIKTEERDIAGAARWEFEIEFAEQQVDKPADKDPQQVEEPPPRRSSQ